MCALSNIERKITVLLDNNENMSDQKNLFAGTLQPSRTPRAHNPTTPFAISNKQLRHKTSQSAESSRRSTGVRPGSARGILRRLAKITAPTTKRRVVTPATAPRGKENLPPQLPDDSDEDLKVPKFTLDVDNNIEDEESELLVAPTPSAVFRYSDDEDDQQPTLTFLREKAQLESNADSHSRQQVSLFPQSDSAIHDEELEAEDNAGDSTFLTERGRRAISEDPTRMSRYSFGSFRMSDFGSELEIRRESDRQKKLAELEAQDGYEYDNGQDVDDMVQLGGETEDLRNLQRSPSVSSDNVEETLHVPIMADDSFQLDAPTGADRLEETDALAHQRIGSAGGPVLADSVLEIDDIGDTGLEDELKEISPPSEGESRRQTLLESVAAAAKPPPRKKLKLNRKGNMVPCFPSSLIKRIVNESQEKAGKRKIALGKDHMKALEQAAEWFFEQVGEDLETFSSHSKRKKRIDKSDVLLLMRRQRVLRRSGELQELAREWLPREILDDFDFSEES